MHKEDTKVLFEQISRHVNAGTIDAEELQKQVRAEHNYLQRQFFLSVVKPSILALADDRNSVDARNRDVVLDCRQIATQMGWR